MGKRRTRNKKKSFPIPAQRPELAIDRHQQQRHLPGKIKCEQRGKPFLGTHPVERPPRVAKGNPRPHPHTLHTRLPHHSTNDLSEPVSCTSCESRHRWREQLKAALQRWVGEMNDVVESFPQEHEAVEDEGMDWQAESTVWICYVDAEKGEEGLQMGLGGLHDGTHGGGSGEQDFVTPPCTPDNGRRCW